MRATQIISTKKLSNSASLGKQSLLRNFMLSVAFLLYILAPIYVGKWSIVSLPIYLLFPVLAGTVLVLFGNYNIQTITILMGLFIYTIIIIFANGVESLRLGVFSAIFLGLLFSNSKVFYNILLLSILCIVYILYINTGGFERVVNIYSGVAEGMSYNYFGQALFFVLIANILSETNNSRSSFLAFAIFVTSIFVGYFVQSRQVAIAGLCSIIYVFFIGKHAPVKILVVSSVFFVALYLYDYKKLAIISEFMQHGIESQRFDILKCYVSNLSIMDVFFGSDKTQAGLCAAKFLGAKYLHNGYLQLLSQLGLLGFIMVFLYPISMVYFAVKSNLNIVLALAFVGIYQFVEGEFMWVYFLILFKSLGILFRFDISPKSRSLGLKPKITAVKRPM